jgi:hypothetical protein
MQQLYLSDLGNAKPNVAPDVTTQSPDVEIEANKEKSTQTLGSEKGEMLLWMNTVFLILLVMKEMMMMPRKSKLLKKPSTP